jgi:hypothetical protein
MSPEREFQRLVRMDASELRKRTAQAWRRMRKQNPKLARMLWKQSKQEPKK